MSSGVRPYRVIILPPAERDIDAIHWYIAQSSLIAADDLIDRLLLDAASLRRLPLRHPVVHGRRVSGRPVRCSICMSYRVLYQIRGSSVYVLRFLHGSRRVPRRLGRL